MILVRQRREAHAGLLEVERALLRFGAGEGWGADRLRAARLARRRPFPAAVLHRLGRSETGGKRERRAGADQAPGLQESRDRHGSQITDETVNKQYTFFSSYAERRVGHECVRTLRSR